MKEFWVSSGHHLLDVDMGGGLVVSDDFLKAYLARPEVMPPLDACAAERALHKKLMADPRRTVTHAELAGLKDPDARENWTLLMAFRDLLLASPTLEAAYLRLVRGGAGSTPPLFINQLTQLILRNALHDETDPYVLRAAECFFRPQKLSASNGTILLADQETVEKLEGDPHVTPLVAMLGGAAVTEMEVLNPENERTYQARSDGFDLVLDFGTGRQGRDGFARVIETFIRHLLALDVVVKPLAEVRDDQWTWFIGLDAEATRIGNAFWNQQPVEPEALERIVALFQLTFSDARQMLPDVSGKPVYLILAMTADRVVRVKPVNLIAGLPVGQAAVVS